MLRRLSVALIILAASVVVAPRGARAQRCPVAGGGDVDVAEADARVRSIDRVLRRESRKNRRWNWGWASVLGTTAGFEFVLAAKPSLSPIKLDSGDVKGLYIGGAKSTIATLGRIVTPLVVVWPETTDGSDPCARLTASERALKLSGEKQRKTRLLGYIGGAVLNLAGVAILGFGYHEWEDAAISFATSITAGLTITHTQSVGAEKAWRRYKKGELPAPTGGQSWIIAPTGGQGWLGLTLAGGF